MKTEIPFFKFHPHPLQTGNAVEKHFTCVCCGEERTVAYKGNPYSEMEIERESICLWCIKDGSAAEKFNAVFVADLEGYEKIGEKEREELFKRTPSYISWQSEVWLTHCNAICSFHGDFEKKDLLDHFEDLAPHIKEKFGMKPDEALDPQEFLQYYNHQCSNPSFYKFVCTDCNKILVHVDYT